MLGVVYLASYIAGRTLPAKLYPQASHNFRVTWTVMGTTLPFKHENLVLQNAPSKLICLRPTSFDGYAFVYTPICAFLLPISPSPWPPRDLRALSFMKRSPHRLSATDSQSDSVVVLSPLWSEILLHEYNCPNCLEPDGRSILTSVPWVLVKADYSDLVRMIQKYQLSFIGQVLPL